MTQPGDEDAAVPPGGAGEERGVEDASPEAQERAHAEWAAADALLEGQPTELGE